MPDTKELRRLLDDYVKGVLNAEDRALLLRYLEDPQMAQEAESFLHHDLETGRFDDEMAVLVHRRLQSSLQEFIHSAKNDKGKVHPKTIFRNSWLLCASTILLVAGGVMYFQKAKQPPVTSTVQKTLHFKVADDILPANKKAVLTLDNGKMIELTDDVGNIVTDGKLAISNNKGELTYTHSDVVTLNTMSTPKGSQHKIILSDGTAVWLNAMSSITYPVSFENSERVLQLTGEAYFEVAKDKTKPFRVVVKGSPDIQVLGTHFNVNAYADDPVITTTLIEGSVKIDKQKLEPGEAWINGKIKTANIEHAIAWKKGYFSFREATLEMVLKQLGRWYDVEVEYAGVIPKRLFSGEIGRSLTLKQVLNGLSKTTKTTIKYEIENAGKIIILPE